MSEPSPTCSPVYPYKPGSQAHDLANQRITDSRVYSRRSIKLQCEECGLDLISRPCIVLEEVPHCFQCAKIAVRERETDFLKRENERLEHEKAQCAADRERFTSWNQERQWALDNGKVDRVLSAGGLTCVSLVALEFFEGNLARGLFGMLQWLVGLVSFFWFWVTLSNRAEAVFRDANPKPPEPKPPIPPRKANITYDLVKDFGAIGTWANNYRTRILMRDDNTCQNCGGQPGDRHLEVHHVQTRADSGPDHPANLVTLCIPCHDRENWFGHVRAYRTTR